MAIKPTLRAVFARALAIAGAYAAAGTHEVGGNNRGDQVEFFLRMAACSPGDPWCCAFVYTCLVKGYAQLCGLAEDRASLLGLRSAFAAAYGIPPTGGCATMWGAMKRLGVTHDRHADAAAGSLVFFDFDRAGVAHHIGFVASAAAQDLAIGTIEGNTPEGAGGNQADGDGVLHKVRGRGSVFGFAIAN